MFFMETLYRVDPRGKSFADGTLASVSDTEYYQLSIDVVFHAGKDSYFVRERHGYFDDRQKKLVHHHLTLNPDEGFPTVEDALAGYDAQLKHRAAQGFVHAFSPRIPEGGTRHRVLEPNAQSLLPT
jgi:hypothetical protein